MLGHAMHCEVLFLPVLGKVTMVGFAESLATVETKNDSEDVELHAMKIVRELKSWLKRAELTLAVLITNRRVL